MEIFIICKKCGTELEYGVEFCDKCHAKQVYDAYLGSEDEQEYVDLSSYSNKNNKNKNTYKGKHTKKKKANITKRLIIVVVSVVLVIILGLVIWLNLMLGKIQRVNLGDDLGIADAATSDEQITNIALFGLDTRENDSSGRSDAIIILTIDKKHNKIKMTSIARDTYVSIEGHNKDKITHAWAYGKANLAVKTLNQNFNLDIQNFVSINFYQFSAIIDYIGGVDIDVDESEKDVMNKDYIPYLEEMGIDCDYITKTGMQLLSGGQALAYSRNRYTGTDIDRGNRQREVLEAMMAKVKDISATKYPSLISMILSQCSTSLSNSEMLSIGTWAELSSPTIETLGLPNSECNAKGQTIDSVWYYVYDLDNAANMIRKFILEEE